MKRLTIFWHVFLCLTFWLVCSCGEKIERPQPLINDEAHLNPSLQSTLPGAVDWLKTLQRNLPTLPQLLEQLKIDIFNVSETCLNDTEHIINDILAGKPYATQMLDATAKIPDSNDQWSNSGPLAEE